MITPYHHSIRRIVQPKIDQVKSSKCTIVSYSSATNRATVQVLGTSSTLAGVPVSKSLSSVISTGQTGVLVYTDSNNVQSAVLVAVY